MFPASGFLILFGILYLAIVVGIVVLVITALWRMVRAQELIALRLAELEQAFRGRPG